VENYLSRIIPIPPAPAGLTATPISPSRIQLTWSDTSDLESGFKIEKASSAAGPWTEVERTPTNVASRIVSNLLAQTTYYFRVRAFNLGGDSVYSGAISATTPGDAILLENIPDQSVDEETELHFLARVISGQGVQSITDFEQFMTPPANGSVLFRVPGFSGSTSVFLDSAPNVSAVTGAFPGGEPGARVLAVSCSFSNSSSGWLRLTTSGAATSPNPVIDFTKQFRFTVYTDRPVRIGLGLRETTNAPGTALGSDGGTLGPIEWVGVTGKTANQPQPSRLVAAGSWQTLTFDLANEPVLSFVSGNSVLSTASGLGVLEHLAIVPEDGPGVYNLFVDDFSVVELRL